VSEPSRHCVGSACCQQGRCPDQKRRPVPFVRERRLVVKDGGRPC
jgi:hypothetical protein